VIPPSARMTRRGGTNGLVFQLPQNGRRFGGTPYAHVMSFDVSVAVLGGWLPHWESPVGEQGFDVPYSERMKVVLTVEDDESLESVYRRAIEAIQPRAVPQAEGTVPDPLDSVYWVWFYEPSDEANALHKYYETPRDLVGVDGLARWNRDRGQIPCGDLIRSGNDGLLHGDPLRPYLVLQWPQAEARFRWRGTRCCCRGRFSVVSRRPSQPCTPSAISGGDSAEHR
jgi:hypothetical protein